MAYWKLKGMLGVGDKSSNHGSSGMQTKERKHIVDIEILVERLQDCLRFYEGLKAVEDLIEGTMEEQDYSDEETLQPRQL